mmetsp:Transcript_32365/g.76287  ORF Transcript_32365/g.76287 Transcript_32365/m.76287 type:complete len:329 (+) Transcript_32365:551-1537(+)
MESGAMTEMPMTTMAAAPLVCWKPATTSFRTTTKPAWTAVGRTVRPVEQHALAQTGRRNACATQATSNGGRGWWTTFRGSTAATVLGTGVSSPHALAAPNALARPPFSTGALQPIGIPLIPLELEVHWQPPRGSQLTLKWRERCKGWSGLCVAIAFGIRTGWRYSGPTAKGSRSWPRRPCRLGSRSSWACCFLRPQQRGICDCRHWAPSTSHASCTSRSCLFRRQRARTLTSAHLQLTAAIRRLPAPTPPATSRAAATPAGPQATTGSRALMPTSALARSSLTTVTPTRSAATLLGASRVRAMRGTRPAAAAWRVPTLTSARRHTTVT